MNFKLPPKENRTGLSVFFSWLSHKRRKKWSGRLLFKLCNRVLRLDCSLETSLIWIWIACCTATFGPRSFNCITFDGSPRLFLDETEWDISLLRGVVNVIVGDLWDGHLPLWGHTHRTVSSGLQPPLGASFLMEKTWSRLKARSWPEGTFSL